MKHFAERYVKTVKVNELDLDFPLYDSEEKERNEVLVPHHRIGYCEVPSIEIDMVIDLLRELKESGADRVYIGENVDHSGYEFHAVKLNELI